MMGTRGLLVCAALAASLVSGAAETVRVLGLDAARPYERGFTRDGDEIVVDNGDDAARRAGAVWSLALNQTEARPFTVRTEARCERGPGVRYQKFLITDIIRNLALSGISDAA